MSRNRPVARIRQFLAGPGAGTTPWCRDHVRSNVRRVSQGIGVLAAGTTGHVQTGRAVVDVVAVKRGRRRPGLESSPPEALSRAGSRDPEPPARIARHDLPVGDPFDGADLQDLRSEVAGGISRPGRKRVARVVREHQEPVREPVPRRADLGGEVAGAGQGRAGLGADHEQRRTEPGRDRVPGRRQPHGVHGRRPPGADGEPAGRRRHHRADGNIGGRDLRVARLGRVRPQRRDAGDQEAREVLGVDVGARAAGSDRQSGDAELPQLARPHDHAEVSPYNLPTWGEDHFRSMLNAFFDFEELRQLARKPGAPLLHIGAVEVLSGHFELFTGEELCAECLLASAAIPEMFRAVTVPGRGVYWDGLFSQNPPIHDLYDLRIDELWLIQINSSTCARVPTETHEILDRRNALSGNLSMEQELAFIDTLNRAINNGRLKDPNFRPIQVSRISLDRELDSRSKMDRRPAFIEELREYGKTKCRWFLKERGAKPPFVAQSQQQPTTAV